MIVCGGGRAMIEKMIDWGTHVELWIHRNARVGLVGLQRLTFFVGFKFAFRFLRILKQLYF